MSQLLRTDGREFCVTEARRRFFEEGICPDGGLSAEVLRSWLRCREAAVDYQADGRGDPEGRSGLGGARERSELLLNNASGVMDHVFEQIRASGSMVILADDLGMILHSLGDSGFVNRAQRVALQPGAVWSEDARGTNAIGTALIEAAAVEVIGAEHYLDRNGILNCSAAPIFNSAGEVAGVLDISGDSRSNQRHTLGLVRLATQLLEKRLFEVEHARDLLVAIHLRPECIGGLQEGLLAIAQDGQVAGANSIARTLLKASPSALVGVDFSLLFRLSFPAFMDRCARDPQALQALELRSGERVFSRLRSAGPLLGMSRSTARTDVTVPAVRTQPVKVQSRRNGELTLESLATGDPKLQLVLERAARIAGKDIPLLIQGESGVGKELFARAFHFSGPRSAGPFVALNCAAIPESLIESELFGYVGGAFTGSRREGAIGKVQQAHGGTLFLDEIGDMPLSMQARLLRVLQERCVAPVGGQRQIPVDISLVCATHWKLRDAVKAGSFREDLYYRVNGLTVTLPALRERSDIRCIVARILAAELDGSMRADEVSISEQVLKFIDSYPWPGNIRQLQNVIRVAAALLDDDEREILPVHLPEELFSTDPMDDAEREHPGDAKAVVTGVNTIRASSSDASCSLDEIELEAIATVMREVSGNVSAAARRLGISRNTLYRKIGRMS